VQICLHGHDIFVYNNEVNSQLRLSDSGLGRKVVVSFLNYVKVDLSSSLRPTPVVPSS